MQNEDQPVTIEDRTRRVANAFDFSSHAKYARSVSSVTSFFGPESSFKKYGSVNSLLDFYAIKEYSDREIEAIMSLTERERMILQLAGKGLSDYKIARKINTDPPSVTRSRRTPTKNSKKQKQILNGQRKTE
jgi:DNA-binding NarL/FixJ family response regulator